MLNQYTIKCKVNFETTRKCGFMYKKTEVVKNAIPFHFDMIARDIEELYQMMTKKFDNFAKKVEETSTFYPWSQVSGCCEWNTNFDHALECSYNINADSVQLWTMDVREFSAKDAMKELTIDQIIEVWGMDIAKIFLTNA